MNKTKKFHKIIRENSKSAVILNTVLSLLVICVTATGEVWMIFSYLLFIILNFGTILSIKLPDDKDSILFIVGIMVVDVLLSLYPIYFVTKQLYEGGLVMIILNSLTTVYMATFVFDFLKSYLSFEKTQEAIAKRDEYENIRQKIQKEKRDVENNNLEIALKKYGALTNSVKLGSAIYTERILVFAETKTIIIMGKIYNFSDILDCRMNDEQTIGNGYLTANTTTDTGSMLGRAAVGGLLLGNTGALIGGVTAQKNTVISQNDTRIKHHYILAISVNDLSSPLIVIKTDKLDTANQIVSLVNAIVANK